MGKKNSNRLETNGDETKLINPATDTFKIDLELAKATDPVLIVIRGTPQGKKFSIKTNAMIIGRDKSVDIQIDDSNVSRQHARISMMGTKLMIEDLGSRNGTSLNDEPVGNEKKELEKEDMIKIGGTVLKYLPAGQLETLYHINLTNAAFIDKLTGLYNRKYISEVLEVEFKRARALHSNFSLVLFDIDNFKIINDSHGHDCGDYVLSTIGQQIRASGLRERDLVGRYGGEEFIIILPNSSAEQAFEVSERVRKKIADYKFIYESQNLSVTVSLGVATLNPGGITKSEELYKLADKALYESKRAGKNKTSVAAV